MQLTVKVNRSAFVKAFTDMKQTKRVSTANVAKRAGLSKSFVYHSTTKNGHPVEIKTILKIGKGFGFDKKQNINWVRSIFTMYVPQVRNHHSRIRNLRTKLVGIRTLSNLLCNKIHFGKCSLNDVSAKSGIPQATLNDILQGSYLYYKSQYPWARETALKESLMTASKLTKNECFKLAKAIHVRVVDVFNALERSSILLDTFSNGHKARMAILNRVPNEYRSHRSFIEGHQIQSSNSILRPDVDHAARLMNHLSQADVTILTSIVQRMQRAEIADKHHLN